MRYSLQESLSGRKLKNEVRTPIYQRGYKNNKVKFTLSRLLSYRHFSKVPFVTYCNLTLRGVFLPKRMLMH